MVKESGKSILAAHVDDEYYFNICFIIIVTFSVYNLYESNYYYGTANIIVPL